MSAQSDTKNSGKQEPPPGPLELDADASDAGTRLDRFLRRRFARLPQGLLQKLLRKRAIRVNGERATAGRRIEAGDRVTVRADLSAYLTPDPEIDAAERRDRVLRSERFRKLFRLIHEDDAIVVLDKPAGVVVHPSQNHRRGDTLLDLLHAHLGVARGGEGFQPAFVHRLDQGTSGLIVAAKRADAARELERAFRTRAVEKIYLALARGAPSRDEDVIDAAIHREVDAGGVSRFRADADRDGGQRAVTRYRVLERFKSWALLRVEPSSGRTHQIRAHLAGIGHPIAGDGDYGSKPANRSLRERFGLSRTFLHAAELRLPRVAGEGGDEERGCLELEAPLPKDLRRVLDGLGGTPSE